MGIQLLVVPSLIGFLGEDAYGQCLWVIALSAFCLLTDPGLIDGGVVFLMRAQATESGLDPGNVWKTHRTYCFLHALFAAAIFIVAGFFVPVKGLTPSDTAILFALAAAYYAAQSIQSANMHYLTATRMYDRLAIVNAVGASVGIVMAVVLVSIFLSPVAYISGLLLGASITIVTGTVLIRKHRATVTTGPSTFDFALAKEFLRVGWKTYPNRLLMLLAGIGDRLLLGPVKQGAALTHYETSTRIPNGMTELTGLLRTTIQADIAQSYLVGPSAFAAAVDRYSRLSLALGICLVVVPSAFGAAILDVWLGDKMYAGGPIIMVGIALYRAFELYYGCHGLAMMAALKPHLMFPAILWNASMTIVCTIPAYTLFGVEGLAYMNVLINALLLFPLISLSCRYVVPALDKREHAWAVMRLLTIGVVVSAFFYAVVHLPFFRAYPILGLLLMPVGTIVAGASIFGLRLVATPLPVARFVNRVLPGATNWLSH
jgi:O-antigen/teichoic acid export membrane protein